MEADSTAPPIVLRADITRAELRGLKAMAALSGLTVQQYLAHLIRERLAA
jgi:hypothetical protein